MSYKLFVKPYLAWLAALLTIEMLSWLSYVQPSWRAPLCLIVLVIVFALSCVDLWFGVAALLAELVIGSQGYLLALSVGSFAVSLRLGLFAIVMLAWVIDCIRHRQVRFFQSFYWKWYLALVIFLVVGVITGYLHGNLPKDIFLDWNGYLYIGMILPFTQAITRREQVKLLLPILYAGITILFLQTSCIVLVFGHPALFQYYLSDVYRWIRDFRIGEITAQDSGFYRVFFQSHIYVLFGLCLGVAQLLKAWRWPSIVLVWSCTTLLLLSYSRTFWLASIITIVLLLTYATYKKLATWKTTLGISLVLIISICIGYATALALVNVPLSFDSGSGVGANSLITDRTDNLTGDVGGGSRLALLKPLALAALHHPLLGSGFGTTVTYATKDPRALASNPTGLFKTYSFEWGYLDLWLKLGLVGTVCYLIMLGLLVVRSLQIAQHYFASEPWLFGSSFALIGLVVVHALTPYLNHPLGIGWLLLMTVVTDVYAHQSR